MHDEQGMVCFDYCSCFTLFCFNFCFCAYCVFLIGPPYALCYGVMQVRYTFPKPLRVCKIHHKRLSWLVLTRVNWFSSDSGHRWGNVIIFLCIYFCFCRVWFDACLGCYLYISTSYRFKGKSYVAKRTHICVILRTYLIHT